MLVNHNTSAFAELALRSLIATHAELLASGRLRVTVVDNHSGDEGLADLRAACDELDTPFQLSAWPAGASAINSHGDVRRDFVADHESATHFLFVDAEETPFPGQHRPRCHPALALVINSDVFRRVADVIGLSAAMVISATEQIAGFADTLGLATMVMQTHGLEHVLSDATVGHYHGVSYADPSQPIGNKLADCRQRLAGLRGA